METTPNDPLGEFLSGDYVPPKDSALKRRLLVETAGYLRRRRRWRRAALITSWAASFALGALAMLWWRALLPPAIGIPQNQLASETKPSQKPTPPEEIAPPSPVALALAKEWEAFDSAKNRAALFFEAGDRYLVESNDIQSALRCYRQALDASSARGLAISPDDNWLVMALKDSRRKEKRDEEMVD